VGCEVKFNHLTGVGGVCVRALPAWRRRPDIFNRNIQIRILARSVAGEPVFSLSERNKEEFNHLRNFKSKSCLISFEINMDRSMVIKKLQLLLGCVNRESCQSFKL
jgi:hypothetical protein